MAPDANKPIICGPGNLAQDGPAQSAQVLSEWGRREMAGMHQARYLLVCLLRSIFRASTFKCWQWFWLESRAWKPVGFYCGEGEVIRT